MSHSTENSVINDSKNETNKNFVAARAVKTIIERARQGSQNINKNN